MQIFVYFLKILDISCDETHIYKKDLKRMKPRTPDTYHAKIPDWPEVDRPREKLMKLGPERLSEAELLAILLRTGTKQLTAVGLAKIILGKNGTLADLCEMDYRQFFKFKGIGPVKAVTLIASFEIARRIASRPIQKKFKITDPEVVYQRYGPLMAHWKKEVFSILLLNSANLLIKEVQVSEGTLNASLVHPREVFRSAILESAASIILIHNHPSGEVQPSTEDRSVTKKLVEAGNLMGINVLDHIIIGRGKYFSFRENGLITG